MQVTLKKAAELSRLALEKAKATEIQTSMDVSIYDQRPLGEIVSAETAQAKTNLDSMYDLIAAAFALRMEIGRLNAEKGINALLTERAGLEVIESRLKTLASSVKGRRRTIESVEKEIEALRNQTVATENALYGTRRKDEVSVPIFDDEWIKGIEANLAKIARDKSDIRDKIAGINLNTHLELSQDVETSLRRAKLIA